MTDPGELPCELHLLGKQLVEELSKRLPGVQFVLVLRDAETEDAAVGSNLCDDDAADVLAASAEHLDGSGYDDGAVEWEGSREDGRAN